MSLRAHRIGRPVSDATACPATKAKSGRNRPHAAETGRKQRHRPDGGGTVGAGGLTDVSARRADTNQDATAWSLRLAPRLGLSAGSFHGDGEDLGAWQAHGVCIGVLESGRMRCHAAHGGPAIELIGPCAFFLRDGGGGRTADHDAPLRYAIVHVDGEDAFGLHVGDILKRSGGPAGSMVLRVEADRSLQRLVCQILSCPLQGALGEAYLAGKALELAALASAVLLDDAGETDAIARLSAADMDRILAARDVLLGQLDRPPSLPELAQAAGINARKLTRGFRQVFGTTVYEFVQEARLTHAHRLLSYGESTVSEAAYTVGYSLAHFSTAFRKRFGVSPSQLR